MSKISLSASEYARVIAALKGKGEDQLVRELEDRVRRPSLIKEGRRGQRRVIREWGPELLQSITPVSEHWGYIPDIDVRFNPDGSWEYVPHASQVLVLQITRRLPVGIFPSVDAVNAWISKVKNNTYYTDGFSAEARDQFIRITKAYLVD